MLLHFCPLPPPLPFVIDDSSWKNAADESFTVALTLTLRGVQKCNSATFLCSVPALSLVPSLSVRWCNLVGSFSNLSFNVKSSKKYSYIVYKALVCYFSFFHQIRDVKSFYKLDTFIWKPLMRGFKNVISSFNFLS